MRISRFESGLLTAAVLWLGLSGQLAAQGGTLRGQIHGPDGKALKAEIRFHITSSNGNFQQYFFSDSNGRIIVPGLRGGVTYTLTVESDDLTYERYTETFNLENLQYLNIFLQPKAPQRDPRPVTVTVPAEALGRDVPAPAARSYSQAMKLVREGKLEQALPPLGQAIQQYEKFFEAHNDLGVVYMQLNRLPEAEKALRRATELRPRDYRALRNLGVVLLRQERYAEAVAPLESSWALKRELLDTRRYLGEALLEAGRLEEADQHLSAAYEGGHADRPVIMLKLAIVKVQKNDTAAAIRLLEQYLADYPKASNRSEIESILKQLRP